jgi:hypothetical protein
MLLLACTTPESPPAEEHADVEPGERLVELVLDRGRPDEDGWVSEPVGSDTLVEPAVKLERGEGTLARAWATLPLGEGVARIRRDCGEVSVPYRVGAEQTVLLPYPACDVRPVGVVAWGDVARLRPLGLFTEVAPPGPGQDDLPARWITLAEARAFCAWHGLHVPPRATAPVDVWLADGSIAGPAGVRDVPDNARTETIGVMCE